MLLAGLKGWPIGGVQYGRTPYLRNGNERRREDRFLNDLVGVIDVEPEDDDGGGGGQVTDTTFVLIVP